MFNDIYSNLNKMAQLLLFRKCFLKYFSELLSIITINNGGNIMKRKKKIFFVVSVMAFLTVSMFLSTNVLGEEVTIKGEVNENYQIVAEDGQIYEVADTEKGDEVVFKHIGKIVKISGTIEESDEGEKIITVISYEVEEIE